MPSNPKRVLVVLSFIVLLMRSGPYSAFAQTTEGTITGSVHDSSAAAVAGAAVTVTNGGTGATTTVVTNELGNFLVTGLPVGTYNVSVSRSGFSTFETVGLYLGA